jgi:hypothetical protein
MSPGIAESIAACRLELTEIVVALTQGISIATSAIHNK